MNLIEVNNEFVNLLYEFNLKELPNKPNLNGVFEQTEVTFAIASGDMQESQKAGFNDYIDIRVNVSISANFRSEDDNYHFGFNEREKSLYELMQKVVSKLQNRKVPNGRLIKLKGFENFTPESGKWRSLLNFSVPILVQSEADLLCCTILAS